MSSALSYSFFLMDFSFCPVVVGWLLLNVCGDFLNFLASSAQCGFALQPNKLCLDEIKVGEK